MQDMFGVEWLHMDLSDKVEAESLALEGWRLLKVVSNVWECQK